MVKIAIADGRLPEAAEESALQHPLFLKLAIELLEGAQGTRILANTWAERTFMRMKEYAESDPLCRDDELQLGFPDYLDVAFLVDAHEFGNHTRLSAVSAMTCSKEREMLEAERDEIMQTKSDVLPRMVRY
jgi:hypothetical protein